MAFKSATPAKPSRPCGSDKDGPRLLIRKKTVPSRNEWSRRVTVLGTLAIFAAFCVSTSSCAAAVAGKAEGELVKHDSDGNVTLVASSVSPIIKVNKNVSGEAAEADDEDDDYYYYYDSNSDDNNSTTPANNSHHHHHRRRHRYHDETKVAQVIVYFSVIFIALAGVLIKYFVTQYETSQFKAQEQLHYQRLQNSANSET